ncbi:unnamed protein product, partial [Chrysoparadoxa australica]
MGELNQTRVAGCLAFVALTIVAPLVRSFTGINPPRLSPEQTPLPRLLHRVLEEEKVKERLIIIGDVHGCFQELKDIVQRLGVEDSPATVILAGDLVNKGPKSAEVVRYAREKGFYAVTGNHENLGIAARLGRGRFKDAKKSKLRSFQWAKELSTDDVEWLMALPYTISLPSHQAIVVHAGLVPGIPVEENTPADMSMMRNVGTWQPKCADSRETVCSAGSAEPPQDSRLVAWDKGGEGCHAWAKAWKGPMHVFFGHDAKRGLQEEAFATGLDTGCVYGRSLTACVLTDRGRCREIVSVPARMVYEEPGK